MKVIVITTSPRHINVQSFRRRGLSQVPRWKVKSPLSVLSVRYLARPICSFDLTPQLSVARRDNRRVAYLLNLPFKPVLFHLFCAFDPDFGLSIDITDFVYVVLVDCAAAPLLKRVSVNPSV